LALAQLERAAHLLDERLVSGGEPENLLEQLQSALDAALDAIQSYAGSGDEKPSGNAKAMASAAVGPLLSELLRALDLDNPDTAEPILAALANELPEEMLRGICERMEAFDFRAAEVEVKTLAGDLHIRLEE
jgi:hypothetical protein